MTLKDRYGFGGFSGTPPSEPNLSTPPPPPPPPPRVSCYSRLCLFTSCLCICPCPPVLYVLSVFCVRYVSVFFLSLCLYLLSSFPWLFGPFSSDLVIHVLVSCPLIPNRRWKLIFNLNNGQFDSIDNDDLFDVFRPHPSEPKPNNPSQSVTYDNFVAQNINSS